MRAMKNASTSALVGIWMILLTAFVVTILYVGRQLLIPLALAAMLTFLLAPLVGYIERWIGRIAAVLIVVAMLFGEASRLPDEHRQQIERDPTSHRRCVW
jgi:predicted PurR-regulated permease PerM